MTAPAVLAGGGSPSGSGRNGSGAVGYLPTYASKRYSYDPIRNLYNFKPSNTFKTRASLSRAASGGVANLAFVGNSLFAAGNGAGAVDRTKGVPAWIQTRLAASGFGITSGGDGIAPTISASGILGTGWATAGAGWDKNSSNFLFNTTGNAGQTATYVSIQAGTIVEVPYSQVSNNFTVNIDGAGAVPVVPTGAANQWGVYRVVGLPNQVHTVVITMSGTNIFIKSCAVMQASGLICHNVAIGGGRAATGTNLNNWTGSLANGSTLPSAVLAAFTNIVVDAVFIELGSNDILNGNDPITTALALQTIRNYTPFATADVFLVPAWKNFANTDAQWNAYMLQVYRMADTLNCPLIDWNDRIGGQAQAQANGMLGPDNIHGTYATYGNLGTAIADLLLD